MTKNSNIKAGVFMSYFVIVFNIMAGLLYTPWMIEKIGKADYGLYVLVTSFLAYFTVDYGLWQAINKLVAEQHVKGDERKQNEIVSVASTLYIAIDLCIGVVLFIVYSHLDVLFGNLTSAELELFKQLYIIAAIFALLSFPFLFLKGIYMAKELFMSTKLFDLLKKVGVILITIVLLYFDFGVIALVVAFGLTPILIHLVEAAYIYKKGVRVHLGYFDKGIAKSITTLSVWLFIIVLGELFITNISPTILASVANTEQIAVFAIGVSLYSYVYSFAGAINGFFLPKIYRLKLTDSSDEINRMSILVSNIQIIIVGLFITGIVCLGQDFIQLWVGTDFKNSYFVVCLLLLPCIVTFCQPIESTELFAANKLKYRSIMMICTAISSVLLSLLFCPIYGAVGAALSIAISNSIFMALGMNICYALVLKRKVRPFILLLTRFLFVFTVCLIIFKFLMPYFGEISWQRLVISGLIFLFVYTSLSFMFSTRILKEKYIYPICSRIFSKK